MSNINQIEKDGVVYNIEDANAQRKTLVVKSASYITLDDSMSTAVPSLSVQQVTNIYNAITDGKEVYIEDMLGDNRVLVSQKALPENNIAIYFSYLARLELTYTIVNEAVKITYTEIGAGGAPIATTISSSSTNTEVAGAKAVYDALQEVDVTTDGTTISKNIDGKLQAIGLTDGTDGLTFQEIYNALTIRRHS